MTFGASLVAHGLLGYADAHKWVLQRANGTTVVSAPATHTVWKTAGMTAALTLIAAYGHQYLNETYGSHITVQPPPPSPSRQ